MKILKTENIKEAITAWAKTAYPEPTYEVGGNYGYTHIQMKEVGSIDLSYINRRQVHVKGTDGVLKVGGGVMFGGRRDGSMIIHGDAKSDFGIFDEVELKRRIDKRFAQKREDAEQRKKSEQVYKDKIAEIDPVLISYGFVPDNRYSWQKSWEYDRKIQITLRQGGGLQIGLLSHNMTEEQVMKFAKLSKELLNGELTSNPV